LLKFLKHRRVLICLKAKTLFWFSPKGFLIMMRV